MFAFLLQFDPINTSKDSTTAVTTDSGSGSTNTPPQDKTETATTTVSTAAIPPAATLTTTVASTANVTMETENRKSSNDSETSGLLEANKEKSESSSAGTSEQTEGKVKETIVENKSTPSDAASKMDQTKEPTVAPEPQPPLSPAGSLHSDSGESGTGVGDFFFFHFCSFSKCDKVPQSVLSTSGTLRQN